MEGYPREHKYDEPYLCAVCEQEVISNGRVKNGEGYIYGSNLWVILHFDCAPIFRRANTMSDSRDYMDVRQLAQKLYREQNV